MKIVEINYTDLPGRKFDGYDLIIDLEKQGLQCKQIVLKKYSDSNRVLQVRYDNKIHAQIKEYEKLHGIPNMLIPYGRDVFNMEEFKNADVKHFHILHNEFVSLLDYPELMKTNNCVWTIHDPWITTGGCLHPLECKGYKNGCKECDRCVNAAFLWEQKKRVLSDINPNVIVSTEWMKEIILSSPLTAHFNKIKIIPFGVKTESYKLDNQKSARKRFNILDDEIVISFRADDNYIKGTKYLYNALNELKIDREKIVLLSVGAGIIPGDLKDNYKTISLGWVDDDKLMKDFFLASDIFVMPSLAESFGVMAIEAMAAATVVVCFDNTVVSEIVAAPDVGVAAKYKSVSDLRNIFELLINNDDEISRRKVLGLEHVNKMYPWNKYVSGHVDFYHRIVRNNSIERKNSG